MENLGPPQVNLANLISKKILYNQWEKINNKLFAIQWNFSQVANHERDALKGEQWLLLHTRNY